MYAIMLNNEIFEIFSSLDEAKKCALLLKKNGHADSDDTIGVKKLY